MDRVELFGCPSVCLAGLKLVLESLNLAPLISSFNCGFPARDPAQHLVTVQNAADLNVRAPFLGFGTHCGLVGQVVKGVRLNYFATLSYALPDSSWS